MSKNYLIGLLAIVGVCIYAMSPGGLQSPGEGRMRRAAEARMLGQQLDPLVFNMIPRPRITADMANVAMRDFAINGFLAVITAEQINLLNRIAQGVRARWRGDQRQLPRAERIRYSVVGNDRLIYDRFPLFIKRFLMPFIELELDATEPYDPSTQDDEGTSGQLRQPSSKRKLDI